MLNRLKKLFVASEQDLTTRQRIRLARNHLDTGNLDDAYSEAMTAVKQAPEDADAQRLLGEVLLERKDLDRALHALERALELDPQIYDVHYYLGQVHMQRKDLASAIEHYRKELARNPSHARVHCNLAIALYATKRPKEAVQHADRAKQLGEELSPDFLEKLKPYR